MNATLSISQISQQLHDAGEQFSQYCSSLSDDQFFSAPPGKWSPAQQTRHLIKATDTARLAFVLPKFMVRWIGGKPNRNSRTYDELVAKYNLKLGQGGRSSRRYIPKPIPAGYGKERLLKEFNRSLEKFDHAVARRMNEDQLEQYLAPHPLLGRLTLRELCYFTIHHAHHHLNSIKKMQAA